MRILAFQPLPYGGPEGLWHRDMGLLVRAWNAAGHTASLVLFAGHGDPQSSAAPLQTVSVGEAGDPAWWMRQRPDAVVFNTWGAPRFAPLWKAARAATPRVLERLDTDGLRSPRLDFLANTHRDWSALRDATLPWKRALAPLIAPLRSLTILALPGLLSRPMADLLANLPAVTAESPIATARMQQFLRSLDHPGANVHFCPHPVDEADLVDPVPTERERRVFAVGRWPAHQKNFPLLLHTLERFLGTHPEWTATVAGILPAGFRHPSAGPLERVAFTGPLAHPALCGQMSKARILLATSRHESFHIGAAEALCSGCSVVGPSHLASFPWFAGAQSGRTAPATAAALSAALAQEAADWESGARDPRLIADHWRTQVGSRAVAARLIGLLEALPGA